MTIEIYVNLLNDLLTIAGLFALELEHGRKAPSFELGCAFRLGHIGQIHGQPLDNPVTKFFMHHFPASENDRGLDLETVGQKFPDVLELELIIMLFGFGPEADFL